MVMTVHRIVVGMALACGCIPSPHRGHAGGGVGDQVRSYLYATPGAHAPSVKGWAILARVSINSYEELHAWMMLCPIKYAETLNY